ncbi:SIMPL domain-containing protein [Rhizobium helianthi]|uniref:SIMPL domain-containing protein n=1 Tax=Rhizobium helianthi TaxID=1132695 RepID=A0ABW4M6I2_9HYPH
MLTSVIRSPKVSLCVLLLSTSLLSPAASYAQAPPPPPHAQLRSIDVSGEGIATVAPDMAVVSLSVTRVADTAAEALTQNNEAMRGVLDALKADGVAERDVQTGEFSIFPRYSDPQTSQKDGNPQPQIDGYQVTNSITVRVRDLTKLGGLIDKSVKLGVNQGGQITFTNHDPKAALQDARRKAVADAMEKAKTLAEAAGVALGPVLTIEENNLRPQPVPMMRMAMAKEADSVPLAGGENNYTVVVNMRFDIKP